MSDTKRTPVLFISAGRPERHKWSGAKGASCNIVAYPAYQDGKDWLSFRHRWDDPPAQCFDDLMIHIFCSDSTESTGSWMLNFGYKTEHSHEFIKLERAEAMVKTLRRINKAYEKLHDTDLRPRSLGQDLRLYAQAIGCKQMMMEDWWNPSNYASAVDTIDEIYLKLCQKCKLLAGKGDPTTMYTAAVEDFDGFGTETVEWTRWATKQGDRYRKVLIQPQHYEWQTTRYLSGNRTALDEEEFRNSINSGLLVAWESNVEQAV